MTTARTILDATISEKEFQQQVVDAARRLGWRCFHTYDSRRSEPGFPDLLCVRDGELIVAELKSERGRLSPAQQRWIAGFREVQYQRGVRVFVWKPSDWEQIERVLR